MKPHQLPNIMRRVERKYGRMNTHTVAVGLQVYRAAITVMYATSAPSTCNATT